ncbi:putative bifunctional diguanylate cyclase/phosphodiesterase [Marinobacterium jannaschii]|uniref:putative bifunctional diguanylate cyclase/phosphodiesterase n=1 Tax=Marinobacterium jannaschii TaxID=64970 RepID=UPI000685A458|nr:bifunctional diguanylate cyclase/phosphodiesterase [Marinobacterium jannaschii]
MTIKKYLLQRTILFSVLGFLVIFVLASQVYNQSIRENASNVAERVAHQTFNSMYLVMSQGWDRQQLERFIQQMEADNLNDDLKVSVYRGPVVEELFGPINQPAMDKVLLQGLQSGDSQTLTSDHGVRFTYPLIASEVCLQCHVNASVGDSLGIIDVQQDIEAAVDGANRRLILNMFLLAPLPLLLGFLAVRSLTGRFNRSIDQLGQSISRVDSLSDLKLLEKEQDKQSFQELATIFRQVSQLSSKLREVAVDKELLEFEIRLLEKFVITSEVVRDWREYINYLLIDINQIIVAHTLFSIFKIDDEVFDLEIFWLHRPTDETRDSMEKAILRRLRHSDSQFCMLDITVRHNIANSDQQTIELDQDSIELQCKSLLVEAPKIGGIVGIGVQSDIIQDQTKMLVLESILSTLLNVVGSVRAIYKYTKDLEYYATRDPLTNLYNQRMFWELLDYELDRCSRHDEKLAVLMIDLDNFKTINDGYGHSWGDRLLASFAELLQGEMRSGDMVARYGGDEFVIMLPGSSLEHAESTGQALLNKIREFSVMHDSGNPLQLTASIGIGLYPDHASNKKELFMFVDNLMYRAKQDGKNRLCIASESELVNIFKDMNEKTMLVTRAIEQRTLIPAFQPIMHTDSGEIRALEVLSRIQLPDETLMSAAEFIEIAESMGKIHLLDYIVMDKAFAAARAENYQGLLFVNMSPRAVIISDFLSEVKMLTAKHQLNPTQIVFEITERDTIKNISVLERFVGNLRSHGYKLAIDDFGSGFSSFHYLKHLPIDYVKIEGEFIANMASDNRDMAFVSSIAKLSQELKLETIAEFVESQEVLEMVSSCGIDYAQGYHIGRPNTDLPALLRQTSLAAAEPPEASLEAAPEH